jgi:hypothetical protein
MFGLWNQREDREIETFCHRRVAATRYLVFAGPHDMPAPGWGSFIGAFGDKASAIECASAMQGWSHVVDLDRFGPGAVIWRDGKAVEE